MYVAGLSRRRQEAVQAREDAARIGQEQRDTEQVPYTPHCSVRFVLNVSYADDIV